MMKKTYNHPRLSTLINSSKWLDVGQSSNLYQNVLSHQGLLTDQLVQIANVGIHVECVSQKYNQENTAQRRDVVIFVDDTPRVLASTIIPSTVLERYPSLLTLANNPIGEHLETQHNARRATPTYQAVANDDVLNSNFEETGRCYLRKYLYLLEHGEITIVELFSPQILVSLQEVLNSKNSA